MEFHSEWGSWCYRFVITWFYDCQIIGRIYVCRTQATSYRIVYIRPAKFTTSPMCLCGLYEHRILGQPIWFYRFRLARAIAMSWLSSMRLTLRLIYYSTFIHKCECGFSLFFLRVTESLSHTSRQVSNRKTFLPYSLAMSRSPSMIVRRIYDMDLHKWHLWQMDWCDDGVGGGGVAS